MLLRFFDAFCSQVSVEALGKVATPYAVLELGSEDDNISTSQAGN
jgi:hypothetical protein